MAEAFAKKFGKNKFEEFSAGNKPTSNGNLVVVEAIKEAGIDIPNNKPKLLTAKIDPYVDLIVTWVAMIMDLPRSLLQANN